jgi:SnoaL-like domain
MVGPNRSAYVGIMPILSTGHDVAAMAARGACRQLLDHVHASVDEGRASAAAGVFTVDAVVELPSRSARGASEISHALAAREASPRTTVHVVGSFDFQLVSEDDGTAAGSLVIYGGESGQIDRTPEAIARYAVTFHRAADGWRIARLELRLVGHDGSGA